MASYSRSEVVDLSKSTIAIALAFTILWRGQGDIIITFFTSIITVGLGFVLHELAHKFFAQRFGAHARFVSDDRMLLIALATAFLGFLLAAPGAVRISGRLTRQQFGLVSVAGPATNIVLSVLFLAASWIIPFLSIGALVNAWLAVFNMIPFNPFDGKKVLSWNKTVYGITVALGIIVLLATFLV